MTEVSKKQSLPHSGILGSQNSSAIETNAVDTALLISKEESFRKDREMMVIEECSLTNANVDEGTTETSE